jgi:hypothetical protein
MRTTQYGLERLIGLQNMPPHRSLYLGLCAARFHVDGRIEEARAASQQSVASMAPFPVHRRVDQLMQTIALACFGESRSGVDLGPVLNEISTKLPDLSILPAIDAWQSLARGDLNAVRNLCDATECGDKLASDSVWLGSMYLIARCAAALGDRDIALRFQTVLAPYTNLMSWAGQCTFGPVDLALAELACTSGDLGASREYLSRAQQICTSLHAPIFATELQTFGDRLDQLRHS